MNNVLKYWELSAGAETGSICMDAAISTATVTGLTCGLIDVHADTVFTTLTAWDVKTGAAVAFRVDNGLSGVTRAAGLLWPGYGRYFTDVAISTGQISYYIKRDS